MFALAADDSPHKTLHNTAAPEPLIVTLGDSFGAGTGQYARAKDYDDPICLLVHDTALGSQYASSKNNDIPHIVTACAGSEVFDTARQWYDLAPSHPEQFNHGWEGSLLIFSVGGNALRTEGGDRYEDLVRRCVTSECHKDPDNELNNLDLVEAEMLELYQLIVSQAPRATIRVMGYPRPFHANNFWCFVPGVTIAEARHVDGMVDQLVNRTRGVVESIQSQHPTVDIKFVDVRAYYKTGACFAGLTPQIRGINWNLFPTSFHPTKQGYDRSETALRESMPSASSNTI